MKTKPKGEHPIRTWRLDRRKTLAAVAAELDIYPSHLCELELRKKQPSVDLARAIAKLTGLSLEQVIQ
jgi:transcriptional regulator with XRE-family HTH domain